MLYDDDSKLIYKGDYDANTFEKGEDGDMNMRMIDLFMYLFVRMEMMFINGLTYKRMVH